MVTIHLSLSDSDFAQYPQIQTDFAYEGPLDTQSVKAFVASQLDLPENTFNKYIFDQHSNTLRLDHYFGASQPDAPNWVFEVLALIEKSAANHASDLRDYIDLLENRESVLDASRMLEKVLKSETVYKSLFWIKDELMYLGNPEIKAEHILCTIDAERRSFLAGFRASATTSTIFNSLNDEAEALKVRMFAKDGEFSQIERIIQLRNE